MTHIIDRFVTVTAVLFNEKFEIVPRRIEFDGVSYDLETQYKKLTITTEDSAETVFDISDGQCLFRLKHDTSDTHWRLLSMTT